MNIKHHRMYIAFLLLLAVFTEHAAAQKTSATAKQQPDDSAQISRPRLHAVARAMGDSVILRWAPSTTAMWLALSSTGVVIDRIELDTTGKKTATPLRLTRTPVRAWDSAQWKPYVVSWSSKADTMMGIAAQCLLGTWGVPKSASLQDFRTSVATQGNRFTFALFAADNSPQAATALGLRYVDTNVEQGKLYAYRIYPAEAERQYRDTAFTSCVAGRMQRNSAPPNVRVEEREGKVLLLWDAFSGSRYSGYYVYRSSQPGKENRLNTLPVVSAVSQSTQSYTLTYEDTTAGFYKLHTYSVRGIDPFGMETEPAEVQAMGRDKTPPAAPVLKQPYGYDASSLVLEWQHPNSADVRGYMVMKSDSPTTRFYPLHKDMLMNSSTKFIDTLASSAEPYYAVVAFDSAMNATQIDAIYADIRDTLAPEPPADITATIDSSGIVRLQWKLGAEPDLYGYRVLWANQQDHEFTQRSNLILTDTMFTDTVLVNTLTPYVYYKIVAVDNLYHHSVPSQIIKVKRPDIVPPESPFISTVVVEPNAVHLSIAHSMSADVAEHILERKQSGTEWKAYALLGTAPTAFTDTSVQQNIRYEYRLLARDSSGLVSLPSSVVFAQPYDTGVRPVVTDLRGEYDSVSQSVRLSWKYNTQPKEKYWFVVYRALDDNDFTALESIPSAMLLYNDSRHYRYGRHRYAVRVISEQGESPLSETVTLVLQ